jgi:hypothetical protein
MRWGGQDALIVHGQDLSSFFTIGLSYDTFVPYADLAVEVQDRCNFVGGIAQSQVSTQECQSDLVVVIVQPSNAR